MTKPTYDKQQLKELLEQNVVSVTFRKKDGDERQMICTLKPGVAGVYEKKTDKERPKRDNDNLLAVWDLECDAFRSFRVDSVLDCTLVG